ncbi:MAG: transglutaminase family protein [Alphaproteobacteria bacterium]|nr:transglutaminase family protein [Alphaproteobacteria bacterium]
MTQENYLHAGAFVDSDHPLVIEFAQSHGGDAKTDIDTALNLFYAVRDEIFYDPYRPMLDPSSYRASDAVKSGRGFCVPKSALLAACARIHGIPARPGYADVRNHLATQRLLDLLGTDLFYWHSYSELYLDGKWVKCTPVFNKKLCDRFGLKPLDFDGQNDSLFHEFDKAGQRHMEYLNDRGTYTDVPFDEIIETFTAHYSKEWLRGAGGEF